MSSGSFGEEDCHPNYDPKKYYPAHIGEIISRKYQIVSKLGWGANSTVWLAKDIKRWVWQSDRYMTLKITNHGQREQRSAQEEIDLSRHISHVHSSHEGKDYIRLIQESFEIQGPERQHLCLVFDPLREPLWLLARHLGSIGLQPAVAKPFIKMLLQGLDFLHSECHIIHTDLKSDNFLLGFEDPAVIEQYVRKQAADPPPSKILDGRTIFQSRPDFGPLSKGVGLVNISDFSASVFGDISVRHNHNIQPRPFCAPEVLLKATWTYSADIWNFGTMLWELLANDTLFPACDSRQQTYSEAEHIAQVIALLGKPPTTLLQRADQRVSSQLFSSQGAFKYPHLTPQEEFTWSSRVPFLQGEDKRLFIEFVKRMIRWDPAQRSTARELYTDPWLDYRP